MVITSFSLQPLWWHFSKRVIVSLWELMQIFLDLSFPSHMALNLCEVQSPWIKSSVSYIYTKFSRNIISLDYRRVWSNISFKKWLANRTAVAACFFLSNRHFDNEPELLRAYLALNSLLCFAQLSTTSSKKKAIYKTKREERVQFAGCLWRISQHSAAQAFLSIVKPNSSYILA